MTTTKQEDSQDRRARRSPYLDLMIQDAASFPVVRPQHLQIPRWEKGFELAR